MDYRGKRKLKEHVYLRDLCSSSPCVVFSPIFYLQKNIKQVCQPFRELSKEYLPSRFYNDLCICQFIQHRISVVLSIIKGGFYSIITWHVCVFIQLEAVSGYDVQKNVRP